MKTYEGSKDEAIDSIKAAIKVFEVIIKDNHIMESVGFDDPSVDIDVINMILKGLWNARERVEKR